LLKNIRLPVAVLSALALGFSLLRPVDVAAQKLSFIRDTEIENTIRAYATPVFLAAGLDPSAVRIYLVNDKSLNAFVAGGQNLFINTGLLMRSENAEQVIGVIAHETGHIAGGHLARGQDAIRNASAESILAMVLGAAAAVASGRPDVGSAVAAGGRNTALRSYLSYSRTQEGAADAAAMRFLDATGQSAKGLLEFMHTLEGEELLPASLQDPYLRTHPLSRDRILALEDFVAKSPNSDKPEKPEFEEMHRRMVAKLYGFMDNPTTTLRRYPLSDTSLPARYAQTIAFWRKLDMGKALAYIDALIAEHPDDPYFHELKGQMLYETGHPAEALKPYEAAVRLMPDAPLLRIGLADVQLELNNWEMLEPAIVNLRAALFRESNNPSVWRQLGIAYGRKGDVAQSSLALAEEALLVGDKPRAKFHAGKAEQLLPKGSPGWLQADDILQAAEQKDN
jgi:predicted Zn-dependent protease